MKFDDDHVGERLRKVYLKGLRESLLDVELYSQFETEFLNQVLDLIQKELAFRPSSDEKRDET